MNLRFCKKTFTPTIPRNIHLPAIAKKFSFLSPTTIYKIFSKPRVHKKNRSSLHHQRLHKTLTRLRFQKKSPPHSQGSRPQKFPTRQSPPPKKPTKLNPKHHLPHHLTPHKKQPINIHATAPTHTHILIAHQPDRGSRRISCLRTHHH